MTSVIKPSEAMLRQVINTAKQAGSAIMQVYRSDDFAVEMKSDQSPVTRADIAAHQIIVDQLSQSYPQINCLSEESSGITFAERQAWQQFFLVDPLDGTKEFIAGNNEFSVNIALINRGKPVLGVIYAPVTKIIYYALQGHGAYKQVGQQAAQKITVRKICESGSQAPIKVITSRRRGLEKVRQLCQKLPDYELVQCGSSLKMCMIAEGSADLCPQLGPTSEWDTAAAQVIVEQAGGSLVQLDFTELIYNQKESLLNPFFLCIGDSDFEWQQRLVI